MARLYVDGFELGDLGAEVDEVSWDITEPTISTVPTHGGSSYSALFNPSNDFQALSANVTATGIGVAFLRGYIYAPSYFSSVGSILGFQGSAAPFDLGGIYMNSMGQLGISYFNGSLWSYGSTVTSPIIQNVWHYIEISCDTTTANKQVITARLDGSQFATQIGTRTLGTNTIRKAFWGAFYADNDTNGTGTIYFDDVAVNDNTGSNQNSWPGAGNLIRLTPEAAGDANSFATQVGGTAGSANNFTRVDELTPDDATTYNGSSTVNQQDLFNVSTVGLSASATVNAVLIGGVFRNSTADTLAAIEFQAEKTSGGTISSSAAIVPDTTAWNTNSITITDNYPLVLYNDPDGSPWTNATINSMQIGYQLSHAPNTGGRRVDVSTVWAYVDFTSPSITPVTPTQFVQKSYRYSIFRNGNYLGDLVSVTSEFAYSQDINTAGSQTVVTVALSADNAAQPSSQFTDEAGVNFLTDESNNVLWSDGQPDVIGSSNDNILCRNGNDILIYEYSKYSANGKLMFTGFISSYQANFGGKDDNTVTLTCLSSGSDMNNYLIIGGYEEQIAQDTQHGVINGRLTVGNVVVPSSDFSVGQILLWMWSSSGTLNVTVDFYIGSPSPNTLTLLGTVTSMVTNTTGQYVTFTFPNPIPVISGVSYFFQVTPLSNNSNQFWDSTGNSQGQAYQLGNGWSVLQANSQLTYQLWSTNSLTQFVQGPQDPSAMLQSVITNYVASGGSVSYTNNSIVPTGLSATYTWNVNTILEGVNAILALAGANYYWYNDIASNIINFKPAGKTPTYILTRGVHFDSIQLIATIENLKNVVYFSGGSTGTTNLYVGYTNTASITANDGIVGLDRISDSNVTDPLTALQLAQDDSNQHASEEYATKVTILDGTMDITLPHVGDMVGFSGFGTFVDSLLLQIARVDYLPEEVTLTLGKIQPRTHTTLQDVKDALLALQVAQNPTSPS